MSPLCDFLKDEARNFGAFVSPLRAIEVAYIKDIFSRVSNF